MLKKGQLNQHFLTTFKLKTKK